MDNQELEITVKKQELKIQALNQSVAEATANYENKIADMRVEYTLLLEAYQALLEADEELPTEV